jgi:cytochrome P450 family 142 subfamily A polypeptide 1
MLRKLTNELLDKVAPAGRCDFVLDVARWIPMVVIGDLLGVAPEDREQLLVWSDEMLGGGESQKIADDEQRRLRQREVVNGYFAYAAASLAERRVRPRDDLMSILAHAEVEGDRLSDEEILQESLLILIGGDETTRHVMTGGLLELLRRPEQKRRVVENPQLIPSAVEEMLRWISPIQNMNRTATRDTELRGQKIRAGDRLLLLYPSANRDAAAFERADEFDVARSPNRHVAFGGFGTHHCLGASLARLELRVLFEELLRRFPNIALGEGELHTRPSNFIVGLETMPVRLR